MYLLRFSAKSNGQVEEVKPFLPQRVWSTSLSVGPGWVRGPLAGLAVLCGGWGVSCRPVLLP